MTQGLPSKGDVIAQKYQVERALGMGGMGAVFEVTHRVTGKRFAIKWLLPNLAGATEAVQRFIREAQVAGRFEHPNVVEVFDIGQEGESFYMVMELLQGRSLKEHLTERGRLGAREAADLMVPVLRGLCAAHGAGIIHRDLKPENIFLCQGVDGRGVTPKVLDFGISKMGELAGEVRAGITKTGMVMGTPHYMSPEQIRAKSIDERSDVYACGVILYELVSGELPFPGDTYSELVLQIVTQEPKPVQSLVPELPEGFAALIERAMAREPEERFANAAELAAALEAHGSPRADSGSSTALPLAQAPSQGRPARRAVDTSETPMATMATPTHRPAAPASLKLGVALGTVAVLGLLGALFALGTGDAPEAASGDAPPPAETPPSSPATAAAARPGEIPIEIDLNAEASRDGDAPPPAVATQLPGAVAPVQPAARADEPGAPAEAVQPAGVVAPATATTTTTNTTAPTPTRGAASERPRASSAERRRTERSPSRRRAAAEPPPEPSGAGAVRSSVKLDLDDF